MRCAKISAVVLFLLVAVAAYTSAADCTGKPNAYPIYNADLTQQFVKRTKNGLRYLIKSGTDSAAQNIHLIHLYGSAYEMGVAYGELMKEEISEMISACDKYWATGVEDLLKFLPEPIRKIVAELGFHAALDAVYFATAEFTPQRFTDELKGIAAGSNTSYVMLRRLNLLPELTQAHCSIIGAWGDATAQATPATNVLQLRALDWDYHAPLSKWPAIVVYHPTEQNSYPFANLAYVGLVGTITGYSNASVGIGEKVWYGNNNTSRVGKPWMYVLRDALQFGSNVESVIKQFEVATRTAAVFLSVGDNNTFRAVGYSPKPLQIINWDNPEWETAAHPKLKDVVYIDKHVQPSGSPCFGSLIKNSYGKISAQTIFREITPIAQTGNMQTAVFDFKNHNIYISYSADHDEQPAMAYDRQFVQLNAIRLFNQKL